VIVDAVGVSVAFALAGKRRRADRPSGSWSPASHRREG